MIQEILWPLCHLGASWEFYKTITVWDLCQEGSWLDHLQAYLQQATEDAWTMSASAACSEGKPASDFTWERGALACACMGKQPTNCSPLPTWAHSGAVVQQHTKITVKSSVCMDTWQANPLLRDLTSASLSLASSSLNLRSNQLEHRNPSGGWKPNHSFWS